MSWLKLMHLETNLKSEGKRGKEGEGTTVKEVMAMVEEGEGRKNGWRRRSTKGGKRARGKGGVGRAGEGKIGKEGEADGEREGRGNEVTGGGGDGDSNNS